MRTLSLLVAITVRSLMMERRMSVQVGKSNFKAVILRKKKPKIRQELARRYLY